MVHPHQLYAKVIAELHALVSFGVKLVVLWGKRAVGFFHSALQHTNGKLTGIHRRWDLANKMAEGANMVQVPVGKHMPADFVLVF